MGPLTLAARITAGLLVLLALLGGLGAYQLSLIDRLHADNRALAQTSLAAAALSLEMRQRVDLLDEFTRKLLLVADPGYAGELRRLRGVMEDDLERLRGLDLAPVERRGAERFSELWRAYATAAPRWEGADGAPPAAGSDEPRRTFAALRQALDSLLLASRQAMAERIDASAERAGRARWIAWGTALAGLLTAALLTLALSRSVTGPLRRLTRGTRELARGDFSHRVEVRGPPELAALAEDFNTMASRLDELDRLKREFLTTVSHDLKAPLASMAETTRLLLDRIPGELTEKQERLLRLNLQSGDRLSRMIADLLDLARLEAGVVEFEMEPRDLTALARTTLEELEGLLRAGGVRVETAFPEAPVPIVGDDTRLAELLANLISNAHEFTPEGGAMGVRVQRIPTAEDLARAFRRGPRRLAAPLVALEVWDSGPGVADHDKEKIFERFHRGKAPRRAPQGTGLGLAIARRIATAHRGEVWVEDRPGGGSRFILALPPAPRFG
jgi:two-component system sensor histidine kinase GlrK